MKSLNRVQLIGNVTADPEVKETPAGKKVASFSLATNMSYQDSSGMQQDQVEFHNIVIWGRLAEVVEQYVKKGAKLFLEGRLGTKSWEDQNGVKRYKTEAICNEMIMLSSKNTETTTSKKEESKNGENINIEEVPF